MSTVRSEIEMVEHWIVEAGLDAVTAAFRTINDDLLRQTTLRAIKELSHHRGNVIVRFQSKDDADRYAEMLREYESPFVEHYNIPSFTYVDRFYTVTVTDGVPTSCTCPSFEHGHGRACKHMGGKFGMDAHGHHYRKPWTITTN